MRTIALAPALAALALLGPASALAFVTPQRGSVLADLDVRRELPLLIAGSDRQRHLHAWGEGLSAPCGDGAVAIARDFLRSRRDLFQLSDGEIDSLVVLRDDVSRTTAGGVVFRTVWLGQQVGGVLVDQGAVRFAIDPRGRVVWVDPGALLPGLSEPPPAAIGPDEAVVAAARHVAVNLPAAPARSAPLAGRAIAYEADPGLSQVVVWARIFPLAGGQAVRAWQVLLEPLDAPLPAWYAVTVDARGGRLLQRTNLTRYVTNEGLVFAGNHPDTVPEPTYSEGVGQSRVGFGYRWPSTAGWTTPAPYGDYQLTVGNNVEAKEDWLRDNEVTIGRYADGGSEQEFLFPFTDAYARSTAATDRERIGEGSRDIEAVITNLFYWNNVWHDHLYELGFTESAGNFQFDNFGRGGCGGDAVRAYAQVGGLPASGDPLLNNAAFTSPPEAADCSLDLRPRMQMFLTRGGTEDAPSHLADTSLDADVILHEYAHGLSERLVGGPFVGGLAGHQANAMAEGWSDWCAASYLGHPVVGEYAFGDPIRGVREYPMDLNPRTYSPADMLLSPYVHTDGEIHASALWDVRQRVGRGVAEQLVMDGLKLTPLHPTFLDFRDALLIADRLRHDGRHTCDIWAAYLARGMGFDADAIAREYPVSDFTFPAPSCSGWAHPRAREYRLDDRRLGNGDGLLTIGEVVDLEVRLDNRDGGGTATGVMATVTTMTPGIRILAGSRSYPDIPAGGLVVPLAPFELRVEPGYLCGAPIELQVAIDWAPSLARVDPLQVTTGSLPGVVIFADDGESTPLPITVPGELTTSHNHTPGGAHSYHTLARCYDGDEPTCTGTSRCNSDCTRLILPRLTLAPEQAAQLTFWARYNVELGFDGLFVEASTDGGDSWQVVDTLSYPADLFTSTSGCRPGEGLRAVSGPPGNGGLTAWSRFTGDLSKYAGAPVDLVIRHHQDPCVVFEGVYIDDIEVTLSTCNPLPHVRSFVSGLSSVDDVDPACSDDDGRPDPGETVDVTVRVTNSGSDTARGLSATLASPNPAITVDPATRSQALGDLPAGASGTATFRYGVALDGVECFETARFELDLSADGGAYRELLEFTETLRSDETLDSWLDDFEGGRGAWLASLGPDGTASDWGVSELDCLSDASNRFFWATNRGMDPAECDTGEPDYSADSDSLLTSSPIDLGAAGMRLLGASWEGFRLNSSVPEPGFVDVLIDHDGDGLFTRIASEPLGFGSPHDRFGNFFLDIADNSLGVALPAAETARLIRVQFRFRAFAADPGPTFASTGMLINDFRLDWQRCDVEACAPGVVTGSADRERRWRAPGGGSATCSSEEVSIP